MLNPYQRDSIYDHKERFVIVLFREVLTVDSINCIDGNRK